MAIAAAPVTSRVSTAQPGLASPRLVHTGGCPAVDSAAGNNSTPVITELYLTELFVPAAMSVTGISVFNGSDVTGNLKAGLYDANGVLIAASASTAGSGVDTYQNLPFATDALGATLATNVIVQPGTYYVGVCYNSATARYNTHAVGAFGASKVTGLVYATNFAAAGTALTVTVPTTFTTALGNLASLY